MKHLLTTALACIILFATACKKEKAVKANKIGGEYAMYEIEQQNPLKLTPVPDPSGNHGSIILTLKNDSTVAVVVVSYNKDNQETDRDDFGQAKIVKDEDGDFKLVDNLGDLAWIWEDYDMDFYGYDNYRIGAKKK